MVITSRCVQRKHTTTLRKVGRLQIEPQEVVSIKSEILINVYFECVSNVSLCYHCNIICHMSNDEHTKYLVTNLKTHDLKRKSKNKWRVVLYSWRGSLSFVNTTTCPKLIYNLNVVLVGKSDSKENLKKQTRKFYKRDHWRGF